MDGPPLQALEDGEADLVGDLEEEVAESLHGKMSVDLTLKNVTPPRVSGPIRKWATFRR